MKPAKKQTARTFRVRLTPARDLTTGKALGDCQIVHVSASSAVTIYGDQEGDSAVLQLIDGAEAVVFTCPLDRLIDCLAVGNLISETSFAPTERRMTVVPHGS